MTAQNGAMMSRVNRWTTLSGPVMLVTKYQLYRRTVIRLQYRKVLASTLVLVVRSLLMVLGDGLTKETALSHPPVTWPQCIFNRLELGNSCQNDGSNCRTNFDSFSFENILLQ